MPSPRHHNHLALDRKHAEEHYDTRTHHDVLRSGRQKYSPEDPLLPLRAESLEPRYMMDGAAGTDLMDWHAEREPTDLIADVRNYTLQMTEEADIVLSALEVLDPDDWQAAMIEFAPQEQGYIDQIFSDGILTAGEVMTMTNRIANSQTVTHDSIFEILQNPDLTDRSEWQTLLLQDMPQNTLADRLQSKFGAILPALDLAGHALEDAKADLDALLQHVEDRVFNADIDFSTMGSGPFSHRDIVHIADFGTARIVSGGPPDPFVTTEGYYQTGTGFSGLTFLDHSIFLHEITFRTVPGHNQ